MSTRARTPHAESRLLYVHSRSSSHHSEIDQMEARREALYARESELKVQLEELEKDSQEEVDSQNSLSAGRLRKVTLLCIYRSFTPATFSMLLDCVDSG